MDKVILELKPEAHKFLQDTLSSHLKMIQMVDMNPLFKKELIDDVSKIKITINNAKKGAKQ